MAESKELDSESEYEEETTIVLVELKGVIDSDLLTQTPFDRFKLIGVETENPILQLNNYYFSGEYNEAIGTAIFFEEDGKKYKKSDPIFCHSPTTRLKYVCSTSKTLNMKRIFVAENKSDDMNEISDTDQNKNAEILPENKELDNSNS